MTLADLLATIRERTLTKGRDAIVLAWRSAFYRRTNRFPSLRDELDDYGAEHTAAWAGEATDVDDEGRMTAERSGRVWNKLRAGLMIWNAKHAEQGA